MIVAGLRRLLDVHGRASLHEYLGSWLVCIPSAFAVSLIPDHGWPLLVRAPLMVGLLVALVLVTVRRLHDAGRPTSDIAWLALPCLGGLLVTVWCLGRSEEADEAYVLQPPRAPGEPRVLRLRAHRRTTLDAAGNVTGHEYVDDWGNVIPDDAVH